MSEDLVKQEFLTELESILESDEAYGSNVQILTYLLKENVINGKFKDSWNNRVYEFIIDVDGISYKPAARLDSFSEDELPSRFDSYSKGYTSSLPSIRLDRNTTGKRVKKPKCGRQGYGCGYSCIGLLKTCRILSSGNKAGTNQGKAIGKERLTKLMDRANELAKTGDKKGASLVSAVATTVQNARIKYTGSGAALMSERALAKEKQLVKSETTIKTPSTKSLEKAMITQKGKPPIVKKTPESLSLGANKDMSGFDLKKLDLSDMFLKGGNFSGSNLERSNFSGANLANANFKESYLRKVIFSQSNIDGANFTGADITDADFTGVNLKNVDLSKAIGYDPNKHKA